MKFVSISYKNYRCFQDVKIDFKTTDKQNIALIIAPNGGGKTEMLFSFWWVLYGFDFKTLKEKKDAPFSLNLAKYNRLMRAPEGSEEECSVTLRFIEKNIGYIIKKVETFTKKGNSITSKVKTVLAYKDSKGNTSTPIIDQDAITRLLTKIIPVRILHGIIFDGERMKQLSTVDDDAKEAIQGIIKDITNEELFEKCKTELADLKRENTREEKKILASQKNTSLTNLIADIESAEEAIKFAKKELEAKEKEKTIINGKLKEINVELKKDETARELEIARDKLKEKLAYANKVFDNYVQSFADDLYEAYLLISENLFVNVDSSLKKIEIPDDLTTTAVRSILSKPKCICGHDIGDEEREKLVKLIDDLPPDNIASTILEMTRQAKNSAADVKRRLMGSFKKIQETKKEIENLKVDLNTISSQLTGEGYSKKAAELGDKRAHLEANLIDAERTIKRDNETIENNLKEIDALKKQKESTSKSSELLKYYNAKDTLIRKFESALEEIDKINEFNALTNINNKLHTAYMEISEDFERGRRIRIVQYDTKNKYRLVSYYTKNFEELLLSSADLKEALALQSKTSDEIREELILKICEPNSTGQSKINTLAFAKAILDYSNEERDEDSVEINKEYPFLIDSPFTELSGGNLEQSSFYIHTFSKQIILFVSKDSYEDVKKNVEKYVSSVTRIEKNESESYSYVVGEGK